MLVEDEPNFLSRASLYEVPADMRDHIVIVCDVTSELYTLLLPLRAQSLQARGLYRPVVLFSPRVPTTFHWNRICILPEIYFVRVSAPSTRVNAMFAVHSQYLPGLTNQYQRSAPSWCVTCLACKYSLNALHEHTYH